MTTDAELRVKIERLQDIIIDLADLPYNYDIHDIDRLVGRARAAVAANNPKSM